MTDAFISYSRQNLDFVRSFSDELEAQGKSVWFDKKDEPLAGLPIGSKWWDEIVYGIEQADNFLFIISPESVASPYCNAELAHALLLDKRLVTVMVCHKADEGEVLEAIDEVIDAIPHDTQMPDSVTSPEQNLRQLVGQNWLAVSAVQYGAIRDDEDFPIAVGRVVNALDLDLAWIRMRSQLRQAVRLWVDNDQRDGYLWTDLRMKPIWEMIERVQPELSEFEQVFLRPEFERLVEKLHTDISHERRARIGMELNDMGDPRPGVGLTEDGLPDIVWCSVEGVKAFEMGKHGTFGVPDFQIAKYPVTYKQYKSFIEAEDGFKNLPWWEGLSADDDDRSRSGEQNWKHGNLPAENVNWYDAMAFCRWLSAKTGQEIRLPTEWEWQWAAQGGAEGREYAFEVWDSAKANTRESGLGRTTAVGMYPSGAALCGAMDMSGNVWEWCLNEYKNVDIINTHGSKTRVLRGYSWHHYASSVSVANRNPYNPNYRDSSYGFRLVVVPLS